MNPWKTWLLLFTLSVFLPASVPAQSPLDKSTSFAGEWSNETAGGWVVVIEQEGMKLRASWKESYRDREMTCAGLWFEGTISGNAVGGTRYTCFGRPQPLTLKIVDADTLEVTALARGGTAATYSLKRIK